MSPGKTLRGSVWGRTGRGTESPSLGDRSACSSMKKNQTMQGTFSKLFGKKHAHTSTTSLYATNPPWIFTQEAQEEGTRDFGECSRGGKKTKGEFPWRLFPPGSGVTWALGRRAGAGTRWNLWTGQGDAGKGEEARRPESERFRGPLKRGPRSLPPSPAVPGPFYNLWWGFYFCGCPFCVLPHRISSF